MTNSKNHVELKAELKAMTDKLVSQDKELFANLSKEEITEKKKERANNFREDNRELLDKNKIMLLMEERWKNLEDNRELLDKNKIMLLMEEYKKSGKCFALIKEFPVDEDYPNGGYDIESIEFRNGEWYHNRHGGDRGDYSSNMDTCEGRGKITEDNVIDTLLSLQKKGYISTLLFDEIEKQQKQKQKQNVPKIHENFAGRVRIRRSKTK